MAKTLEQKKQEALERYISFKKHECLNVFERTDSEEKNGNGRKFKKGNF